MRTDLVGRPLALLLGLALATSAVSTRPDDVILRGAVIARGMEVDRTSLQVDGGWAVPKTAHHELSAADLWVDAGAGNDDNDGLTRTTALRSIQRAADSATPGTTVHILPGIYRESVQPALSGSAGKEIIYRAENGSGTVIIRGSEQANALTWSQLASNSIGLPSSVDPADIYYADLSAWALDAAPRFVVQLDGNSQVTRLPLAREPDWQVVTEWKYGEFWWAADGGSRPADCDPATNQDHDCDSSSRSAFQLTDRTNDSEPAGIEAGNLTTLGSLTGATLVALDADEGHYVYRRTIEIHDVATGRITVNRPSEFDAGSGKPGLGWGSKYYVENHPALLDTPGEWWYDAATDRLYLWPPAAGSPATQNIEISRRSTGFSLTNRSYITLDGLTLEFLSGGAVYQDNNDNSRSYNNIVRNSNLRYANIGVELGQGAGGSASNITDGFTLENSELSHMDTSAIQSHYWWPGGTADSFTHAGIVNTVIRNNEMYDLAFRSDSDNADGVYFTYVDRLRLEGNYIHNVAHNGLIIGRSLIQSTKDRALSAAEIKIGQILIKDNVIEKACLLAADCGEIKILGGAPDTHVFRDLLITGNVFRNTFGWTSVSEKRGRWSGGPGSNVKGMGGFGLYLDNASGAYIYRNIAYNNASSGFHFYNDWWDGDIVLYNNVAANSLNGIRLDGDTQGSVNTQIANNIIINNEAHGILIYQPLGFYGNFLLDRNLYYGNGWRTDQEGGLQNAGDMARYRPNDSYQNLDAIRAHTSWEDHGVEGDPALKDYSFRDHDLFDGSWPDFHASSTSAYLLDGGTTTLPDPLIHLLDLFGVNDFRRGPAYDIGPYEGGVGRNEAGIGILVSPIAQVVSPCSAARYTLQLDPSYPPREVTLAVTSPSRYLDIALSSPSLRPDGAVTLTVAEAAMGAFFLSARTYTVGITATDGDLEETTDLAVPVSGIWMCLPAFLRGLW